MIIVLCLDIHEFLKVRYVSIPVIQLSNSLLMAIELGFSSEHELQIVLRYADH